MHKLLKSADSYKLSHFLFYPQNLYHVTSYIEARGWDDHKFQIEPELVVFGVRHFIQEYLSIPITIADLDAFEPIATMHGLPFNREGWERIVKVYGGYVPVKIEALPEGSVVPTRVPLVQVTNNDSELPWLTSYIETALLRSIWYPTTVATVSRECKKIIKKYLEETADNTDGLPFKLHDFGSRGTSSGETSAIGGTAHLVNFKGSDTIDAIWNIHENYSNNGVAGFSIPATEHSVSTTYGPGEGEKDYVKSVLFHLQTYGGLASIVADTYDLDNFVENILGREFHHDLKKLEGKATLVIRPDSGKPGEITLRVIEQLGRAFGCTLNSKGYKVLPSFIRIIQGDGIDIDMIDHILYTYKENGWSADNIAFGMGGNLLQNVNRDTLKFAMKANEAVIDVTTIPIYKSPKTDPGKVSKKGRQFVYNIDGNIMSSAIPLYEDKDNLLKIVYDVHEKVAILNATDSDFSAIRERAKL